MSASEIKRRFPWATKVVNFPADENTRWYASGRESEAHADARAREVAKLIHAARSTAGEDEILV